MTARGDTQEDALRGLDWEALFPRLLVFATWVHRRTLAPVPGAPEPGDLVQGAVAKLLEGRRTLPDPAEVTTVRALEMAIRSEASNARRRAERRGTVRLDSLGVEPVDDEGASPGADERRAAMWSLIGTRVGDDPELIALVGVLREEPSAKPRRVEEKTGMSRTAVYRAMRRLRYRLGAVEDELRHLGEE